MLEMQARSQQFEAELHAREQELREKERMLRKLSEEVEKQRLKASKVNPE